jgi:hypothetical protein
MKLLPKFPFICFIIAYEFFNKSVRAPTNCYPEREEELSKVSIQDPHTSNEHYRFFIQNLKIFSSFVHSSSTISTKHFNFFEMWIKSNSTNRVNETAKVSSHLLHLYLEDTLNIKCDVSTIKVLSVYF